MNSVFSCLEDGKIGQILETPQRIEPARLEDAPAAVADAVADLVDAAAKLGAALHPQTAAALAGLVGLMNAYYSNLIEGHHTRPRDIERALAGDFDIDERRRSLQIEAASHVRLQGELDRRFSSGGIPEPASGDFLRMVHRSFYEGASKDALRVRGEDRVLVMEPGAWRSLPAHDVSVGRHQPPSSERVADFMTYFERRYRFKNLGRASRVMAIPAAHHRFNYIHPFPDGNGRVSRLMSHAMTLEAGIGAHGLWSVSRGLARGLEARSEYKKMMDHADRPRQGDRDGRGNLSEQALIDFTVWFLKVCHDQVTFMTSLFELDTLACRLRAYVERSETLVAPAARLLEDALLRGEVERGEIARATGLPERTARRVLTSLIDEGLLASSTPKGPVSLRFPAASLDLLFPRLFAER